MHGPNILRSEGTAVIFGLTKMLTKECSYTHNFSYFHWLFREGDDGGGVGVEGGGGDQLIISDPYTVLHTFGQKSNDKIYIPFIINYLFSANMPFTNRKGSPYNQKCL